jgi:hypothetical protein
MHTENVAKTFPTDKRPHESTASHDQPFGHGHCGVAAAVTWILSTAAVVATEAVGPLQLRW